MGRCTPEAVRPICGADESSREGALEIDTDDEVDEGSVRGPKHVRDISVPAQEEVDKRNLTHLPFRNWCPHCMKGRGKEAPHRRAEGGKGVLPEISLDFCFPSKEDGTGMLTILGARERHTKMTLSTVIPSKTTGTFAARRVWAFLKKSVAKMWILL